MITVEKSGIVAEPLVANVFNPETGKYEIISEMSYKEWKEWKKAQNNGRMAIRQKRI
jgi:hypothetical protein